MNSITFFFKTYTPAPISYCCNTVWKAAQYAKSWIGTSQPKTSPQPLSKHEIHLAPHALKRYSRDENVKIFRQTVETYSRGGYQTSNGKTVYLGAALQALMGNDSRIYSAIPSLGLSRHPHQTQITVENLSTLRMTEKLINEGLNPLVLDMANRYSAGGGVRTGANAQEEILCRQSNLMRALLMLEEQQQYPIPDLGGIYIPGVQFFRADPVDGYTFLDKPFTAAVFACAAYDCNTAHGSSDRPIDDLTYLRNSKEKIRTMLRAALLNGHDSLVLSAFGCGAFRNDPKVMASLYREIFDEPEFNGRFKKIAFGIIEDHNSSGNFSTFNRIFDFSRS